MRFAGLAAVAFLAATAPAHAGLRLCNQTSYIVYAATAVASQSFVTTQGWTRIAPGACEAAIAGDLIAPAYYLYARSSRAHAGSGHIWGGANEFCAKEGNFTLRAQAGLPGCASDDSFPMSFAKLDTKAMKSWTATFSESARIRTMDAARDAGIDRLLGDLGYKLGGENGRSSALQKFRTHMKLPASATTEDLFDALETEALKASAPAGYSICNDGNSAIWAALGTKNGVNWLTRGWWKVMPGACAQAITEPLSADKIYLHAEGHGNHHLVSGPAKFCVTDITFEVSGKGTCAAQGLTETGFAVTDTRGRAGYAAHVSQDGLVPPR